MRQYIGGVIAERNILSPICLIVQTSPINLANGNGNRFFAQKLHVQIAYNPRSPHSPMQTDVQLIVSFPINLIFVTMVLRVISSAVAARLGQ